MNNPTIADIFANNNNIHEKLKTTLGSLTAEQASSLPEGEKWTISQIVEHLSLVEENMSKICSKLLLKAQSGEKSSDGTVRISPAFVEKAAEIAAIKLEAPDIVHPSASLNIAESISKMDENRKRLDQIRPLFEAYDCNEDKFPHPFLGDISAVEWLTLVGGHEARHLRQIKNLLEKNRKIKSPGYEEG